MGKLFIVEDSHYGNITDTKYLDVDFTLETKQRDSPEFGRYKLDILANSEYYHNDKVHNFPMSPDCLISWGENFPDVVDQMWDKVEKLKINPRENFRVLVKEFKFNKELEIYFMAYKFVHKD